MNITELIGKRIVDIRSEIKDVDYDGSIPLDESCSYLVLDTGERIEIPYKNSDEVLLAESTSGNEETLFEEHPNPSRLKRIINTMLDTSTLAMKNTWNIKGKAITAIYQYDSGSSNNGREWDYCLIEVESGYLISEKHLSPHGTGHAGIWIFTSLASLEDRIGGGFRKLV